MSPLKSEGYDIEETYKKRTDNGMNDIHYKKLERMYLSANINTMLYETTTISVSEGAAEISLELSDKYHHALGAMHGSVYFKLLDDACFFAVNSRVTEVFVLTTSFELSFRRPADFGLITARGKVTQTGDKRFGAESILFNQDGKELASGKGTFVKSRYALSPEIGYR